MHTWRVVDGETWSEQPDHVPSDPVPLANLRAQSLGEAWIGNMDDLRCSKQITRELRGFDGRTLRLVADTDYERNCPLAIDNRAMQGINLLDRSHLPVRTSPLDISLMHPEQVG